MCLNGNFLTIKIVCMKRIKYFMLSACVIVSACQKDISNDAITRDVASDAKNGDSSPGNVYTLSNDASENRVIVFARSSDGMLTWKGAVPTGGTGTGSGLGSQGAIALSSGNKYLLAVNAGSNTISSFIVTPSGLTWASTVASGGIMPISVTIHNNLVYVLNAGMDNNISGFTISNDGELWPLAGSTRPLSSMSAGPAQVSFTDDGDALVITEKATNTITSYTVEPDGTPGMMHTLPSANATPFGFAVGKGGLIYVSEAAGGAPGASTVSSYRVDNDGSIHLTEGPVSAGQTAACWVVVVNNGKYVYATNTGSGNLSSFKATNHGDLDVLQAAAGVTGMGSSPIDAALSNNSKYVYALLAGSHSIAVFQIQADGSLEWVQNTGGLPEGTVGLEAK
jgi:6-phosphogluconolactonase